MIPAGVVVGRKVYFALLKQIKNFYLRLSFGYGQDKLDH